jgi:enamine deaminase RidA (YjgF/YER057c/UK114 family)
MAIDVMARLAERSLALPEPPKPGGSYEPVRVLGNLAYVPAQFPFLDGELRYRGRLGRELTTEDGYRAAELCALNVLAQMHRAVGFDNFLGLNRFEAYLQTAEGWDEFPRVVDGASHLFLHALGEAGRHARALFDIERLPLNSAMELTAIFTLKP